MYILIIEHISFTRSVSLRRRGSRNLEVSTPGKKCGVTETSSHSQAMTELCKIIISRLASQVFCGRTDIPKYEKQSS